MKVQLRNHEEVEIRLLRTDDSERLFAYFNRLSAETKKRFGPHAFDAETIRQVCQNPQSEIIRYVAVSGSGKIVAYSILKKGYLQHDLPRLSQYGLQFDHQCDLTFAPSVADDYQSKGLGSRMFDVVLSDLKEETPRQIVLWGGVQKSNEKAVNFYLKHGFRVLGEFEYSGWNYDMGLSLHARS